MTSLAIILGFFGAFVVGFVMGMNYLYHSKYKILLRKAKVINELNNTLIEITAGRVKRKSGFNRDKKGRIISPLQPF